MSKPESPTEIRADTARAVAGARRKVVLAFLVLSICFTLPNQANIGVFILESFDKQICGFETSERGYCQAMDLAIIMMKLFAVFLFIGTIGYIAKQFREGNFLFTRY